MKGGGRASIKRSPFGGGAKHKGQGSRLQRLQLLETETRRSHAGSPSCCSAAYVTMAREEGGRWTAGTKFHLQRGEGGEAAGSSHWWRRSDSITCPSRQWPGRSHSAPVTLLRTSAPVNPKSRRSPQPHHVLGITSSHTLKRKKEWERGKRVKM